ncbi:hypothetical protein AgCh_005536 [Apium graveolens]
MEIVNVVGKSYQSGLLKSYGWHIHGTPEDGGVFLQGDALSVKSYDYGRVLGLRGRSEGEGEGGYTRHEPYVPRNIVDPPRAPDVGGTPPVLISNADILEQLYRMGDTLNNFQSRLSMVERRKTRRGHRLPHRGHAVGKSPVVEGNAQDARDQASRGNPRITPRCLEYSDDVEPIMELIDEDSDGRERPRLDNQVVPHPHRSGRTMDERHRVENIQNQDEERRDLSTLKRRLDIRDNRVRHYKHEHASSRGRFGNYGRDYQRNGRGRMRYQYGRVPYNGRREDAPSTDEVPVVIPVASHSTADNGSRMLPHNWDGVRIQKRM